MLKYICDVCGKEIAREAKFEIYLEDGVKIIDVCLLCRNAFMKERSKADIEVYKMRHKQ